MLIGRTLVERYVIEEVIGRGGMSVVYRATDQRLGRQVALKVVSLPGGAPDRGDLRDRLRREAASAARIPPHPNVVQVYDYGTDPALDLDFIVMELLRGGDLKRLLRHAPPDYPEAMRILREAARGVAAGHRVGIVHRDVKPANIFLTGSDRPGAGRVENVKILDFGIAKALEPTAGDDLTRTGQAPLSPGYASPEQLRGEGQLTPASDVYQLGLVAYELLAGERPFQGPEQDRIRQGEWLEIPERGRWSRLPRATREVIARALRPDPAQRFPDAVAFVEALAGASSAGADDFPSPSETTFLAEPEPAATPIEIDVAPLPPRGPGTRRPLADRKVQIAAAGLLGLLGLWGISRLGGGDPVAAPAAVSTLDASALDEEFRALQLEAYEAIQEEGPPGAEARAEEAAPFGSGEADAGTEAANEVRYTIADLNQSWVMGEMERHLSHYANRVDFYDVRNARRSRIARERSADLELYPEREITIERQETTFPEPDRAVTLVEKEWDFRGPEGRRRGKGTQEYILEKRGGRWVVVSERLVD